MHDVKTKFKLQIWILITLSMLLLQACTASKMLEHGSMAEPTLEYVDYRVADISLDTVKVELIFKAKNPNFHQIDTFFADYQFVIEEKVFAEGKDIAVTLIPEGESELIIPAQTSYSNLFGVAGSLASMIRQKKKELPAIVKLTVHGEYLIADLFGKRITKPYDYSIDIDMNIPLPEVTVDTIGQGIKNSFKSLFGTTDASPSEPEI